MKIKNKNYSKSATDFMPRDKKSEAILRERAIHIAALTTDKQENNALETYIRFRLGEKERYGIPYHYAKEVMPLALLTPLPCVPKFIAGVINRRGALVTVLDLKYFLNLKISTYADNAFIILITANNMTVGILADSVDGSDNYEKSALSVPLSLESAVKSGYILGLHKGVTTIINVQTMLADCQLLVKKAEI